MRRRGEERRLVEESENLTMVESAAGATVTDVIRDTIEVCPTRGWRFIWGTGEGHQDETIYSVNWIPLGGFVKIHGESGELRNDPRSFSGRPVWQRLIVLASGVVMNLVFAAFLLSVGFAVGLPSLVDDDTSAAAKLSGEKIQIMSVVSGSPAEEAGMKVGDELLSLDNQIFSSAEAARTYIKNREGEAVKFLLKRGETALTFSVTAEMLPSYNEKGVGIGLVKTAMVSYPWYLAGVKGVESTLVFTWEVIKAFGNLLWNLVIYQTVAIDLAGPVGIAVMTGEAAAMGLLYLLQFAAILSINLAVVNILPFPALDGGRLIFLLLEKIRGQALSEKIEVLVHNFGFVLLLILVVLVTFRDVFKFVG
jgi:regulator of sigma E protease